MFFVMGIDPYKQGGANCLVNGTKDAEGQKDRAEKNKNKI